MDLSATFFPDRPLGSHCSTTRAGLSSGKMNEPSTISWRGEVVLRAPTFSIPGLHPDWTRRFHIVQKVRERIGLLCGWVLADV